MADGLVSYQQFMAPDHYDFFRSDLCDEHISYLGTFESIGFLAKWHVEDILARLMSQHFHAPNLLGFEIKDFYALAMIRRGDTDWSQVCGRDVSSMTADDRDALFVHFLRQRIVGTGGS